MLSTEFNSEIISFDYAQFAIAIALSQLGETEAFRSVLIYKCTKNDADKRPVTAIIEERESVEREILESGKGMVRGVLEWLDRPDGLDVVTSLRSEVVSVKRRLSDVLNTHTLKSVYKQTMQIIANNSPSQFILLYIDLPEFREVFYKFIRGKYSKSADGIRANNLNDSILSEIMENFKNWVKLYSLSAYQPNTGTPLPFLKFAFESYYAKKYSTASRFYEILNGSGTNAIVGGDDATALTFMGIDSKHDEIIFDFPEIAQRIYRASILLFSHKQNEIAFYDIFSCYRDRLVAQKFDNNKANLKKTFPGCDISFVDSFIDSSRGHDNTVDNKKVGRIKLCRVFEKIITDGLAHKDVMRLYNEAIALTERLPYRDGVRLFATAGHATRHKESNSEIMQIIVSGFLAVRELIEFIEANELGVSILNFPITIFRNKEYLKRFQTIEEYVKFVEPVKALVEESWGDSEKAMMEKDGFSRNEVIWGFLGSNNLLQNNVFKKLSNLPLGYIKNAVNASQILSKEELLEQSIISIADSCDYFYRMVHANRVAPDVDYMTLNSKVNSLAAILIDSDFNAGVPDATRFADMQPEVQLAVVLDFVYALRKVLEKEGSPIVDDEGIFTMQEDNAIKEMFRVIQNFVGDADIPDAVFTKLKGYIRYRGLALQSCYKYLFDCKANCNWQQLREIFFSCEFIDNMLEMFQQRFSKISLDAMAGNKTYLMLADIAANDVVFSLPQKIYSCDELRAFYTDSISMLRLRDDIDVDERENINHKRNVQLVIAVNKFLALMGEQYPNLELVPELLNKYISCKYSPVTVENGVTEVLIKAAKELSGFSYYSRQDAPIRSALSSLFENDDYGYVTVNGKRYLLDDAYVLNTGYLVRLGKINKSFYADKITVDQVLRMKNEINFRGN